MYGSGPGYRGAPTATFDAPSAGKYNEDALPAMPSWSNAVDHHVEDEVPQQDVEMGKLDHTSAQQESLLPKYSNNIDDNQYYSRQQDAAQAGDLGTMHAGGPYQNYDQHQQFVASPSSTAQHSVYPPTYHTTSPTSTVYEPVRRQQQWGGNYAPSLPPSYRTGPPSVMGPAPMRTQQGGQIPRRPVQGSWRDV